VNLTEPGGTATTNVQCDSASSLLSVSLYSRLEYHSTLDSVSLNSRLLSLNSRLESNKDEKKYRV